MTSHSARPLRCSHSSMRASSSSCRAPNVMLRYIRSLHHIIYHTLYYHHIISYHYIILCIIRCIVMLFSFILYYIEHDTSFHILLSALLFLQLQCARAREDGERIARRGGGGSIRW